MNDNVRTFRAATTEAAMAQIRHEIGLDAVVIDVKQVTSRSLFPWRSSRQEVEVQASRVTGQRSMDAQFLPDDKRFAFPTNEGTIALAAAKQSRDNPPATTKSSAAVNRLPPAKSETFDRGTGIGECLVLGRERHKSATSDVNPARQKAGTTDTVALTEENVASAAEFPVTEVTTSPIEHVSFDDLHSNRLRLPIIPLPTLPEQQSEIWRQATADALRGTSLPEESNRISFRSSPVSGNATASTIEQRLDALQQMIAELGKRPQPRGFAEIPTELFPHYLALIEADVDDEIAHDLILKLRRHAAPGQLVDTAAATALLTVLIEQRIPCGKALSPRTGRRQIAMVVGPTGVGKTTTLAKLAGCFSVDHGLKLGLITVDTYRVAAVEQLRTYAEIIDLPMRVVTGAHEVQEALDSLADRDLVLIDTAGRSPHDDRRLDELKQLTAAVCPDHVYLVLSLASGAKALRNSAERFAAAQPTSLVFTKLDEATGCGGLLAASRDIGLPVSYFTTGQEVPRDIEPANPCRAARLIMGTDRVTNISPPMKSLANPLFRS